MKDKKKRIEFFKVLWQRETWLLSRVFSPKNCISCKRFFNRDCPAMDMIEQNLKEWLKGEFPFKEYRDIYEMGTCCKTWE